MATKYGKKWATSRLLQDISLRFLGLTRGFWGRAIECGQCNSITTNPCCHGNKIWDKMDYNSAFTRNISEICV